jgi:hypothetical protein
VLVFGPGVQINGSALVNGMASVIGDAIPITGGLAGDGGAFRQTWTVGRDGVAHDKVVAIGLCGEGLRFGHGSFGGWEPFGPARKVTRSDGNVLYELDGEPALGIYKRYLGESAKDLPASGLLFPFAMLGEDHNAIRPDPHHSGCRREQRQPDPGWRDRPRRLPETDARQYRQTGQRRRSGSPGRGSHVKRTRQCLAILVSCVGRKLVMGSRVDEEVEAVGDVLGNNSILTGFYSYGEISPFTPGASCKLHNQTMTVTCLGED